jgi:4-hydroxybenzoate polyprenyltransferase
VKARLSGRPSATVIGQAGGSWRALLRALRPRRWVNNTLVFLPLLAAHAWRNADVWWKMAGFFLALGFGSSAVYLLDDLAEIESDRRRRDQPPPPLASGALRIPDALVAVALCLGLAALFGRWQGGKGLAWLSAYVVAAGAYSFCLKKFPILDTLFFSALCLFPFVAGAVLAPATLSPRLIALALFLFLSLAAARRYAQLRALRKRAAA